MQKRYFDIEIEELDLFQKNRVLSVEMSDLECFETKVISIELSDLSFPSIDIRKEELLNLQKLIDDNRKKFEWDLIPEINACHGTRSRDMANSIIKDGWKVGAGNAVGSGIYFGVKQNGKIELPKEGGHNTSGTVADSYGSGGALVFLNIDWKRLKGLPNDRLTKYSSLGGGGDRITTEAIKDGFDYYLGNGYGVMFEPQYLHTKKYWKTDKMRIIAIYYQDNKEVKIFN